MDHEGTQLPEQSTCARAPDAALTPQTVAYCAGCIRLAAELQRIGDSGECTECGETCTRYANDDGPRPRRTRVPPSRPADSIYDPDKLAPGRHTRVDLVWYGAAMGRIDRGAECGPRAPQSLLGQLQAQVHAAPSRPWLAPTARDLEGDRLRAVAIEHALAAVRRLDAQNETRWHVLLNEVFVRRAGQCGSGNLGLNAFFREAGEACISTEQRLTWTTGKGMLRTAPVEQWARRELSKASEAYDRARDAADAVPAPRAG